MVLWFYSGICRKMMSQSKPEVVDRRDFEAQIEALVDAAEDCDDLEDADISDVLFSQANNFENSRWE